MQSSREVQWILTMQAKKINFLTRGQLLPSYAIEAGLASGSNLQRDELCMQRKMPVSFQVAISICAMTFVNPTTVGQGGTDLDGNSRLQICRASGVTLQNSTLRR